MTAAASHAELVRRAQAGDRRAFAELYVRFRGVVSGVVLARVDRGAAPDVIQDVFATAWARLGDLREPGAFPGWVLEVARRRAVDHGRRKRVVVPIDDERDDAEAPEASPSTRALAEQALRAVRTLPEAYRETLLMRLVEGLTGPEIAELTGMTPESVRVNLCRGMKLLREKLEGPS